MPVRKVTALYLILYLILPVGLAQEAARPQNDLQKIPEMSYLDILERADQLSVTAQQLGTMKERFERERKKEQDELKDHIKSLENEEKTLQKQLEEMNKQASQDTPEMAQKRKDLHCRIVKIEKDISDAKIKKDTTTQVEYENRLAKLELAQRWPSEQREIQRQLQAGTARQRQFGNVDDIGVRIIQEGQSDDIKRGQDAIKELKEMGLLPPEVDDATVKDYVTSVGQKLSLGSDLKVPLQVTLLNSEEINAFALPGGYLYINSGLILKAENESELAGVMAHEMAHVTARHSARLNKKATIANVLFQGAQLAAMIFTGGAVSSLLAYYALQYGFYGLGLAISLTLLGVSREYETEADQLGVQYLWKSGYDPKGFVTFFDKMASDKGYVRSTSFFRTHPAFADRIIHSFREITFLPSKEEYIYDTPDFHKAQDQLKKTVEEMRKTKPANAPSLRKKRIDIECEEELKQPPELMERPRLTRPPQ
ncbi:MAG: M48 family metalloprotease [Acidobacteria bacterium]|nr:M48 family metalloprotease [Acidobacteriota bacterium]